MAEKQEKTKIGDPLQVHLSSLFSYKIVNTKFVYNTEESLSFSKRHIFEIRHKLLLSMETVIDQVLTKNFLN